MQEDADGAERCVNTGQWCPEDIITVSPVGSTPEELCGWQWLNYSLAGKDAVKRSSITGSSRQCWRFECDRAVEFEWAEFNTFCSTLPADAPANIGPRCGVRDQPGEDRAGYCDDVVLHTHYYNRSSTITRMFNQPGCSVVGTAPTNSGAENRHGLLVEFRPRYRGDDTPPAASEWGFSMLWRCAEYCTMPPTGAPTALIPPTLSPSAAPSANTTVADEDDSAKQIIAGVIIAVLAILGLLLYCIYSNRHKRKLQEEERRRAEELEQHGIKIEAPLPNPVVPAFQAGDRVICGGAPGRVVEVKDKVPFTYDVALDSGQQQREVAEEALAPAPAWRPRFKEGDRIANVSTGHAGRVTGLDWGEVGYAVTYDSGQAEPRVPEHLLAAAPPRFQEGSRVMSGGARGTVVGVHPDGRFDVKLDDGRFAERALEGALQPAVPLWSVGSRVRHRRGMTGTVSNVTSNGNYVVRFDNGLQRRCGEETLVRAAPRYAPGACVEHFTAPGAPQGFVTAVGDSRRSGPPQYEVELEDGSELVIPETQLRLAPPRFEPGDRVDAPWLGSDHCERGEIIERNADGSYVVLFDDGEEDIRVPDQFIDEVVPYAVGDEVYARRGGPRGIAQPCKIVGVTGGGRSYRVQFPDGGEEPGVPEDRILPRAAPDRTAARGAPAPSAAVGDRVVARQGADGQGALGWVTSVNSDGTRAVQFDDGAINWRVPEGWVSPVESPGTATCAVGDRVAAPKLPDSPGQQQPRFAGQVVASAADGTATVRFDDGGTAVVPSTQLQPLLPSVPRRRPSLLAQVQREDAEREAAQNARTRRRRSAGELPRASGRLRRGDLPGGASRRRQGFPALVPGQGASGRPALGAGAPPESAIGALLGLQTVTGTPPQQPPGPGGLHRH